MILIINFQQFFILYFAYVSLSIQFSDFSLFEVFFPASILQYSCFICSQLLSTRSIARMSSAGTKTASSSSGKICSFFLSFIFCSILIYDFYSGTFVPHEEQNRVPDASSAPQFEQKRVAPALPVDAVIGAGDTSDGDAGENGV